MSRHWTKSYGTIPHEIDPDRYSSVVELMEGAMSTYADNVAFKSFGQSLTFADIDRLSAAFCAYLQNRLGVRKGDRIALMTPNMVAFPVAFLGIIRAGAVQVGVNPLYTPRELQHQLNDAGCKTIIIFNASTPTLAKVIEDTPVENVITAGLSDGLGEDIPSPPVDDRLKDAISLVDALEEGAALERTPVEMSGDDLLFLQYTGGTTGLSKGASLSHRNLVANTEQYKAFLPNATRPGEEVIVTAIPLYHIFALMVNFITYFSLGAENWLVVDPRNMDDLIAVLKAARPTTFIGVNTLYAGLAQHPRTAEVDWSRLTVAGAGGAAVIKETSNQWEAVTGTFLREGYGLSETSPVLSFNPDFIDEFSGTTGLPVPSTDIKLLDDDDKEAPIGKPGEICAKGPQIMSGYWKNPEANATAFTDDGYFRTGDIGVFDERGYLKIVDRKKDMILVSGFNVFPNEVEDVATGCPGVAECACVGAVDEKSGEVVKLFVVKAPGAELSEDDVKDYCRENLAPYKVPKIVCFLDELPKSTVGKILRRELRDMG